MKLFALSLLMACSVHAALNEKQANQLADAIYVVEGGSKTKHPYGIKSVKTRGNTIKARKICINTIQNTHDRWLKANKPYNFLDYLANRYCPVASDATGNERWKKNIRKFVIEIG